MNRRRQQTTNQNYEDSDQTRPRRRNPDRRRFRPSRMGQRPLPQQWYLREQLLPDACQRHALRQPQLSRLSVATTGLRFAPQLQPRFKSPHAPAELRQLQTRYHAAHLQQRLLGETYLSPFQFFEILNAQTGALRKNTLCSGQLSSQRLISLTRMSLFERC